MVLALAAVLVARLTADDRGAAGVAAATATPGLVQSARPTKVPAATSVPSVEPVPSEPGRSLEPDASAVPSSYRVQSGDTLITIAARYGTTWQILVELNGIEDPARLRVGQELVLP